MTWRVGKIAIASAIHLDLTHHQEHYARFLRRYVRSGDRWLDLGCGCRIVPDWAMPVEEQKRLVGSVALLVGVDVDEGIARHPLLPYRVKACGEALPFKDRTFNLVTANMVVEHIADPRSVFKEILRVLQPGGHFLFITPNLLTPWVLVARMVPVRVLKRIVEYLEERNEEDIFPTHYMMNRPSVIAQLSSEMGFEVEELSLVGTTGIMDRLGPLAWLECVLMKAVASSCGGRLQPDIITVLKRKDAIKRWPQ